MLDEKDDLHVFDDLLTGKSPHHSPHDSDRKRSGAPIPKVGQSAGMVTPPARFSNRPPPPPPNGSIPPPPNALSSARSMPPPPPLRASAPPPPPPMRTQSSPPPGSPPLPLTPSVSVDDPTDGERLDP